MVRTISTEHSLIHNSDAIPAFWQQHVTSGVLTARDGVKLAYALCIPAQPAATIVISSGRIEAYLKYQEVMFDLYNQGFAVFTMDHRGQGLSDRMTANPHQGFVRDFADYVSDLHLFITEVVSARQPDGERYLLAHSMGCAIGALTTLAHPSLFQKLVFCSPMFGIRPALPGWIANSLLNMVERRYQKAGQQEGYFIGQKDYSPVTFDANHLTHSELRYRLFRDTYANTPEVQLGGVTVHWLRAAMKAMDFIENNAGDIKQPVLILSAGDDTVVDNRRQRRVAGLMPDAVLHSCEGAYHEILIEADRIREPAMNKILDFLA
ncbi:alpha/beta fold hydrolase [Alteromonas sp. RKMC-009]|uniref:alpha/beta fold hydrolase n=1 Tax=Alteromonas sp. RKMC-009 TaxID=2267264 RepID=UPI000E689C00|nr:alpha/beta fold hydrolase [Alteromonas sp. RKMC-009]AYA65879.1 alpha/beta fold hydrolase [Alteromonas sp. RKMC-009]